MSAQTTSRGRGRPRRGGSTRGWERIRKQILARDMGICHLCGGEGADSVDHLMPFSLGGTDEPSNLAAAHRACNSRRGARFGGGPRTPPTPLAPFSPRRGPTRHESHWEQP